MCVVCVVCVGVCGVVVGVVVVCDLGDLCCSGLLGTSLGGRESSIKALLIIGIEQCVCVCESGAVCSDLLFLQRSAWETWKGKRKSRDEKKGKEEEKKRGREGWR